jgi:hypothetical protein
LIGPPGGTKTGKGERLGMGRVERVRWRKLEAGPDASL